MSFFQRDIEIYASDDNQTYTLLNKIHNDIPSRVKPNEYVKYIWNGQHSARYVRIKAISASDKFFIADELIVR